MSAVPSRANYSEYRSALDGCIRTIALAPLEVRLTVFENMAREAAGFVRKGGLGKIDVVDRLNEAAEAYGLIKLVGYDDVQRTLCEAFTDQTQAGKARSGQSSVSGLAFTLYRDIDRTPRKTWLVENFLGDAELSCDFGSPGCGKSVLAGDRAAHIAGGRPWFGRRVMQGGVLYVAAERAGLVKRRFAAFRLHYGLDDLPLAVLAGTFDLRSPHADTDKTIDAARRVEDETGQKVRLIEIDTVSRVLAGGDENSPKDIGGLVANLARIQSSTGAHVNVLHHVPHGQDRMRGHGALLAAMDTTVHVENRGTFRTATINKTNDGDEGECLIFGLQTVELHHDVESRQRTMAPVILPVDGKFQIAAKECRTIRLPKAAQIALQALAETIDEQGTAAPASGHIPHGIKVITVATWRQQAYRRGISTSEEERATPDRDRSRRCLGGECVADLTLRHAATCGKTKLVIPRRMAIVSSNQ